MTSIDWSKAPEGATHCYDNSVFFWARKEGDHWWSWEKGDQWVRLYGIFEDSEDFKCFNPRPVESDPVNAPSHYTAGSVECIDAIKAQMTREEFIGYLRGNVVKYLWRYRHKGGVESLKKAQWYLDKLISEQGEQS